MGRPSTRTAPPLRGLRVLELAEGVAGPYAGRLLSMLGADVVKLEPAGGDRSRALRIDDRPLRTRVSPLFVHLNAGKRLSSIDSLAPAEALAWADIVLDDRVRSELDNSAWSIAEAERLRDRAVWTSVTAWGFEADDAGRPEDELLVQAASGLMSATGEAGREPLRLPGWQSQYLAGGYAVAAALGVRARRGLTHVDVSWVAAALTGDEGGIAAYLQTATRARTVDADPEAGARQAGFQVGAFPSGAFACADGHVIPGTVRAIDWDLQCQVYGRPDLIGDERFAWRARWGNRELLRAEIQPWYDARGKREIFHAALDAGWAAAMVMTAGDALEDEHLNERLFFAPVTGIVDAVVPARPWRAPGIVEDVPGRVGSAADDLVHEAAPLSPPAAPDLRGHKVLELTWAWAGPFVGRFLGALGADVVRVEFGRYPDGWRTRLRWKDADVDIPDAVDPEAYTWDAAALFNSLNRNKRGVSIDLSADDGRGAFLALLAEADALIANMTYSVLADRGVEKEVEAAVARGLVFVNMPALGATGPYRDMPGYGMLMEGMGGISARFGYLDEGARASTTYYPDAIAGLHGTVAVLAGLTEAGASGRGSSIDLSQQEVTWLQFGEAIALRSMEGREPDRMGNREPGCAPSGVYPTTDGHVAIVVTTDAGFDALTNTLLELADLTGRDLEWRLAHRDELDVRLGTWTSMHTTDEAVATLRRSGVGAAPCHSFATAHESGALADRDMVEVVEHPVTGKRGYSAIPVRINGRALLSTRPAPQFAEHTDEVLSTWANFTAGQLIELRGRESIGTVPVARRR